MRVLWITHDLFEVFLPFVKGKPTKGGSWIAPLFYSIQKKTNITLGSVTPVIGGKQQKQIIDDVTYYSVGIDKNGNKTKMNKRLVNSYMSVIDDFKPVLKLAMQKGIPIHIGEFGSYSKADMDSRVRWTRYLSSWFNQQGFSWAYWEWNAGFGIYDPKTKSYRMQLIDALLNDKLLD